MSLYGLSKSRFTCRTMELQQIYVRFSSTSCDSHNLIIRNECELHQAKRGLMVILKFFVRYISAFGYYEGIYWFCANTFENKILQYFTETSESHVGYFQLWRHILRHLHHLLALCWKSHKPPFRLAQLMCFVMSCIFSPKRTTTLHRSALYQSVTPGSVPFGTCMFNVLRPIIFPSLSYFSGLSTSNIPQYFLHFAHCLTSFVIWMILRVYILK